MLNVILPGDSQANFGKESQVWNAEAASTETEPFPLCLFCDGGCVVLFGMMMAPSSRVVATRAVQAQLAVSSENAPFLWASTRGPQKV